MAQSIPKGYHSVTPYLTIKGAAKALEFDKQAFGATEIMRLDGPTGTVGQSGTYGLGGIVNVGQPAGQHQADAGGNSGGAATIPGVLDANEAAPARSAAALAAPGLVAAAAAAPPVRAVRGARATRPSRPASSL